MPRSDSSTGAFEMLRSHAHPRRYENRWRLPACVPVRAPPGFSSARPRFQQLGATTPRTRGFHCLPKSQLALPRLLGRLADGLTILDAGFQLDMLIHFKELKGFQFSSIDFTDPKQWCA